MKRFIILCIVCVAVTVHCTAQLDSLKTLVQAHTQEDTIRADALVSLARAIVPNAPEEAKRYAEEALHISEKFKWQAGIARSLRMLGYYSYIAANFPNAIDYNLKALQAVEPLNDEKLKGSIFNNMGLVYSELGEFEKSLDYYAKYLAITRELKMTREESIAMMNTGLVHFKNNNQTQALEYFKRSLAIAEPNGFQQVIAYVHSNAGASLNKKGDFKEGLSSFLKSIAGAEKIGDARIMLQSLGGVGESYFHLRQYDKAEEYTKRALTMAKEIPLLEYEKEMYQGLSEIHAKQKQFDKAFDAYKNFVLVRDSILNDAKRQDIKKRELQFEFEKKEALLKAVAAEEFKQQQLKNNVAIGGVAFLLLAGGMIFLLYKRRRDADEQRKVAEFQAQVADTEMKALRSQMNPHFIFNSLNSISDYISKHDIASADSFLTKFAKLMRSILENSEQKEVRLADDLKSLELYMQLESLRLNKKFDYEIQVDERLDKEATLIPPLLLQPFVENSIWHGIAQKNGDSKIKIRIAKEGEMMNCIVEDNGVGREQSATIQPAQSNKQSLGMKITKARIDILNKIKNSNATMEVFDLAEGMRVEVKLPLVLQF